VWVDAWVYRGPVLCQVADSLVQGISGVAIQAANAQNDYYNKTFTNKPTKI
jgi:hypothetical protein